ncbi:MAG: hypothetical protein JWN13_3599 [Betaproteobacteria bacterium]|nr:hypothetical protein [Betaproteobacteria bacterium]
MVSLQPSANDGPNDVMARGCEHRSKSVAIPEISETASSLRFSQSRLEINQREMS